MIKEQVARMIADFVIFLDMTDDETLDPDAAVEMMEELADRLQSMDPGFLRDLIDTFPLIAPEFGKAERLVRSIPSDFYLEEALASDDPVRMAELEAIRDARVRP